MISESQQARHDPINLGRSDQPDRLGAAWNDTICLLGRILIGGIFVQSGFQKLIGLDAFAASLARNGIPAAIAPVNRRRSALAWSSSAAWPSCSGL